MNVIRVLTTATRPVLTLLEALSAVAWLVMFWTLMVLLAWILTSVIWDKITVMRMLCVTTLLEASLVPATLATLEME